MERSVTEDSRPAAAVARRGMSLFSLFALAVMGAIAVAATTYGHEPVGRIAAFFPVVASVAVATQLASAYMLFAQYTSIRLSSVALLGAAYFSAGIFGFAQLVVSPDAFGIAGSRDLAAYLWMAAHCGFAGIILAGAALHAVRGERKADEARARTVTVAFGVGTPLATLSVTAMLFFVRLPGVFAGATYKASALATVLPAICMLHVWALAAIALARSNRYGKMRWVSMAVLASLFDTMMGMLCARYSYGWYGGNLFSMIASGAVFVAFISQITQWQSKLARAHAELKEINAQERREAQERLRYLAYHDELTGLNNRTRWQELLGAVVDQRRAAGGRFAVLFVDLDRFKEVNDALGHAVGDEVLRMAARRLRDALRGGDEIGRLGGDEFAVLMQDIEEAGDARGLSARLREVLRRPFALRDRVFNLSASVGIAHFPENGTTVESLLRNADLALYQAKHDGGDCEREYDRLLGELRRRRRTMRQAIDRALERHEFAMHYQPIVDARSGRLAAAEALIRWNDPVKGPVLPSAFLPIAEETGLMEAIGRWVIEEVAAQIAEWNRHAAPPCVAVNISVRQLQDPTFFDHLRTTVEARGVDPHSIELEVTESVALSDAAAATELLARCRDLGFRIVLDDFGTHYSSLTYLQRLPIDKIKIDRSFVKGLPFNKQDAAIVRSVVALGHDLHRDIVAEGVETAEQMDWLAQNGCDLLQGYLIARPMPASALSRWRPGSRAHKTFEFADKRF